MQTALNPFDVGGFTLTDMTAAINILPKSTLALPASVYFVSKGSHSAA